LCCGDLVLKGHADASAPVSIAGLDRETKALILRATYAPAVDGKKRLKVKI